MPRKKEGTKNTLRKGVGKGRPPTPGEGGEVKSRSASVEREVCERCGQVHEGCRAHTKHGPNTGKPCGMKPRLGSLVCVKHGGNHPSHVKKAKERLLDLVDPALSELHRILTDGSADDSTKVRAALGILDRTGYGPGAKLTVTTSAFEDMITEAIGDTKDITLDRSLPAGNTPPMLGGGEPDAEPEDAWPDEDADDEGRIFADAWTVPGEVVDVLIPDAPDTRSGASEFGGDPTRWPYRSQP